MIPTKSLFSILQTCLLQGLCLSVLLLAGCETSGPDLWGTNEQPKVQASMNLTQLNLSGANLCVQNETVECHALEEQMVVLKRPDNSGLLLSEALPFPVALDPVNVPGMDYHEVHELDFPSLVWTGFELLLMDGGEVVSLIPLNMGEQIALKQDGSKWSIAKPCKGGHDLSQWLNSDADCKSMELYIGQDDRLIANTGIGTTLVIGEIIEHGPLRLPPLPEVLDASWWFNSYLLPATVMEQMMQVADAVSPVSSAVLESRSFICNNLHLQPSAGACIFKIPATNGYFLQVCGGHLIVTDGLDGRTANFKLGPQGNASVFIYKDPTTGDLVVWSKNPCCALML